MSTEQNQKNNLHSKVKLTANILFSGIGCQERGFRDSGLFDVEVLNTSDIDKEAVVSYAAVHCGLTKEMIENYPNYPTKDEMVKHLSAINLGYVPEKDQEYDWVKLAKKKGFEVEKYWLACKLTNNLGDISKIEKLPYADLWTCSFPCFTGDTLVLTKEHGYMPIKDIKRGVSVLTHDNKYRTVLESTKTGDKNVYNINAMCFDKLECTENHRFLIRTRHRVNTHVKGKSVNYRYFDAPIWKQCKELTKNDYLGYAINQNETIPKWEDDSNTKTKLSPLMDNKDFWWIVGRYIADGFKQTSKTGSKIVLCCGRKKALFGLIEEHLNNCGLHYCTDNHGTCINYHICSNELYKFVQQFGDRAMGKFVPAFVIDMPVDLCEAFLDGYWSGDGCFTNNRYKATTISRELIYGLGQLIAKVYHRPFSIYFSKRRPTCIIEGRTVNQNNSYSIMFSKEDAKQDKAFYENGYIWFPINSIVNTNEVKSVYDITVEHDHSFTANGTIVHNCTDISVAGKMKGLNLDSSTRSSLLWENIRLLNVAKEDGILPKYIMFENVKNLVSRKFINDFNDLIEVLDELGFNSYWEVINGKNCGVPQNRERVFVISIRKDIDAQNFVFPKPFDNGLRLKDILEPEVAEKYYLSERALAKFKFYNEPKGEEIKVAGSVNPDKEVQDRVRVLDPTGVSQSLRATDYKDPVKIATGIDKSCNGTSVIEYANCITAREDRGVSNRKSEGTAILEQTHSLNRIGNIYGEDKGTGYAGNVWDENQLCPALTTMQGGNRQPMIMKVGQVSNEGSQAGMVYSPDGISQTLCAGTHGYAMGNILEELQEDLHKPVRLGHFLYPNSDKPHQSNVFYDKNAISPTLDTCTGGNRQTKILEYGFRIRKLTPRECWKLMGFEFEDCDKAASVGITDTHLYKQAGNGIITNCCELLAEHLYKAQYDNTFECFDENFTRPQVE